MLTPCIRVCKLDSNKCVACGRTKTEIAEWIKLSYTEKNKIIMRLTKEGYPKYESDHSIR